MPSVKPKPLAWPSKSQPLILPETQASLGDGEGLLFHEVHEMHGERNSHPTPGACHEIHKRPARSVVSEAQTAQCDMPFILTLGATMFLPARRYI